MLAGAAAPSVKDGRWSVKPDKMHVTVWTRRAENLARIISGFEKYKISGEAVVEAQWVGGADGALSYVSLHSESLGGVWRGKDVSISGDLHIQDITRDAKGEWMANALRTRNLEMRAGKNHAWLLADLKDLKRAPRGSFTVLGRYMDSRDLRQWIAGPKPETRPAGPAKKPADSVDPRRRVRSMIASALPSIRASEVQGSIQAEHLRLWDGNVSQYYDLRDMKVSIVLNRGLMETNYACGLNAGSVRGGVSVDFREDPPADKPVFVRVWQDIRDVVARENIQPQLALFFPGNTVYGKFNRRQDVKMPLVDLAASMIDPEIVVHPVGTAKTITVDGMTQGRAAPKFVTALFPGLNMTSYRYLKMTAFSDLQADGGAYSDMIFSGRMYDMYIEGVTDSKKIGRYEIGLILLGTPQTAEWNHIWRQGRLPILKFQARIEGGKMHDVSVSYPWPNESLGVIFVKNNILYRAYLATQGK